MIRQVLMSSAVVFVTALSWGTEPKGTETMAGTESLYVGAIVCKSCHASQLENDPFTVWSVSKHSRTFVQLGTGYIEMIDPDAKGFVPEGFGGLIVTEARRLGIDTDCLKCHTTADQVSDDHKADTFHLEDGVQCEACHGPGGTHVAWMERGDTIGSQRPPTSTMMKSTLADCSNTCHRDKPTHSPFMAHEFDPQKAWRKIAHGQTGE